MCEESLCFVIPGELFLSSIFLAAEGRAHWMELQQRSPTWARANQVIKP